LDLYKVDPEKPDDEALDAAANASDRHSAQKFPNARLGRSANRSEQEVTPSTIPPWCVTK